jgi:hypothetical protein
MNYCKESRMPIDTSPEGAELLHQPVIWPFPQSTTSKPHPPVDTNDDGHNHEGEGGNAQAEAQDSERGLAHGTPAEQAVAKPPLGN